VAIAIAAMTAAIVVVGLLSSWPFDEAMHALVRWTARTSLVLFALAYVARPAVQLWPRPLTKRLLAERKWIGLGFATSHTAHLAGIIGIASPDVGAFVRAQPPANAVAALTFLLIFAMAFTSIEAVKAKMSARAWKLLHKAGMHFAWLAFASTYLPAVARSPFYALPAAIIVAITAIRVAAFVRMRRRAMAKPASRIQARSASCDT
jgi:methionine sulfoxide reductase heme-binding subunit